MKRLELLGLALLALLAWTRPVMLLIVRGGSMQPTMAPGDIAIVARFAPVEPGAIACFAEGKGLVCHRVVGRGPVGWITQGDANARADTRPAPGRVVVGRVAAAVPSGRLLARVAAAVTLVYHRLRVRDTP